MAWSSASGRKEIEVAVRRLGRLPDEEIELADAALLLASLDRPRVPLERYRRHLDSLERECRGLAAALGAEGNVAQRVQALNETLFARNGYQGDDLTYDDLQNANLMRVIDRRKGLPIALAILYLHTARALGWSAHGLNFPGHFLVRLELGAVRIIVDPFHQGAERSTADLRGLLKKLAGEDIELKRDHTDPCSNRDILLRLQNNIKQRLVERGHLSEALESLEMMLMIAPERATLWQETGLVNARLGNLAAALMAFEHALELESSELRRHELARLIQRLQKTIH